jgi:hypothetical protein
LAVLLRALVANSNLQVLVANLNLVSEVSNQQALVDSNQLDSEVVLHHSKTILVLVVKWHPNQVWLTIWIEMNSTFLKSLSKTLSLT